MRNISLLITIIILIVNIIVAVIYLIYGIFFAPKHQIIEITEEEKRKREKAGEVIVMYDRRKYVISFIVMLLCPVVGPLFFFLSWLFNKLFFRRVVDLADVIFSKEKAKSLARGDDEIERNIVPLEEALAVSDKQSLRNLMLNILKGDISDSLSTISEALQSDDSETAHYAASVLRDELNDFRADVQKLYDEMQKRDDDAVDCAKALMEHMNTFLSQNVFSEMEQESYVRMMTDVASTLITLDPEEMLPEYYEWVTMRLLGIKDYGTCESWCKKSQEQYPRELSSYTGQLKLYFEMGDKEKFFNALDALKASSVVIDKETLELVRTFS